MTDDVQVKKPRKKEIETPVYEDVEPALLTREQYRELVFAEISDLVMDFVVYDRKEDDELPDGTIEDLILDGVITPNELAEHFRAGIMDYVERRV